jgi:hypothetical protein
MCVTFPVFDHNIPAFFSHYIPAFFKFDQYPGTITFPVTLYSRFPAPAPGPAQGMGMGMGLGGAAVAVAAVAPPAVPMGALFGDGVPAGKGAPEAGPT